MKREEKQRVKRAERELLMILYAQLQMLSNSHDSLQKMLKSRTKNGWRDIRMIETRLDQIIAEVIDTIPGKDLYAIGEQMKISVMEIRTKAAGMKKDGLWVLSTEQIALLVNLAIENHCMLCDNRVGQGCELKHLIESMPVSITGNALNAYMACADYLEVDA